MVSQKVKLCSCFPVFSSQGLKFSLLYCDKFNYLPNRKSSWHKLHTLQGFWAPQKKTREVHVIRHTGRK